jgi:DNA-binding LacI/PurR family transcriptional regulator
LIDLGHRNICEISGPLNWFGAAARHQGWRETMLAHGLEATGSIQGDWSAASGYEATLRLLGDRPFTALVAGNDQMALGAIRALRSQDIQVPENVSVTGFDDTPDCAYYTPPLTTVRQEFDQLGQFGVAYLIERIDYPDTAIEQRVIQTTLIQRFSTTRL